MRKYGKLLLNLRAKMNKTQEEMAEIFHVSFATMNRWENDRVIPTKMHIIQIEELLKEYKINS